MVFEEVAIPHGPPLRKRLLNAATVGLLQVPSSDLVPGQYEGGFKLWEGSVDLVACLREEAQAGRLSLAGKAVLELGCGHGLPGIFALQQGAAVVHFQDFNAEVLQHLTAANVAANMGGDWSEEGGRIARGGGGGKGGGARGARGGRGQRAGGIGSSPTIRYFAGDWAALGPLLCRSVARDTATELTGEQLETTAVAATENGNGCGDEIANWPKKARHGPEHTESGISTRGQGEASAGKDDVGLEEEASGSDGLRCPTGQGTSSRGVAGDSEEREAGRNATAGSGGTRERSKEDGEGFSGEGACKGGFYDVILTAETVYSPESAATLLALIRQCLRPEEGVLYLAAKKHYFGVGGGSRFFKQLAAAQTGGLLQGSMLQSIADGSSNLREVWRYKLVQPS